MLGIERENIIGKTLGESLPEGQMEHFLEVDKMVHESGQENLCEESLTGNDGEILTIVTKKTRFVNERGEMFLVAVIRDITERKRAEEDRKKLQKRLLQSQKMEAVGTLAGGIAHDFNNILSAIIGYSELAIPETPEGSQVRSDLGKILAAGNRAKSVVSQILTFSRQREERESPLNIAPIVKEVMKLIHAS